MNNHSYGLHVQKTLFQTNPQAVTPEWIDECIEKEELIDPPTLDDEDRCSSEEHDIRMRNKCNIVSKLLLDLSRNRIFKKFSLMHVYEYASANKKRKLSSTPSVEIVGLNPVDEETNSSSANINNDENDSSQIDGPFIDDIIFEILQFLESSFISRVCMNISKQWRQVSLQIPLSLTFLFRSNLSQSKVHEQIKQLANYERLKNLTSLVLGGRNLVRSERSEIGSDGVKYIAKSKYLTNLTSLTLSNGHIGSKAGEHIATSANMGRLTYLNLNTNSLGNKGVYHLAESEYLKNLTSLNLKQNTITDKGVEAITTSKYLKNLSHLNLGRNNISKEGVKYIANSLENLTSLDLSFIGGEGRRAVEYITSSESMKNLTSLRLNYWEATKTDGAKHIANSEYMRNLTSLSLNYCFIGNEGLKYITQSEYMKNLTSLELKRNHIDCRGVGYIADGWKNLISLALGSNPVGDGGVKYIATSENMKNLTSLNLESSGISDEGVKHITTSKYMENLEHLDISENNKVSNQVFKYFTNSEYLKKSTVVTFDKVKSGKVKSGKVKSGKVSRKISEMGRSKIRK